MSTSPTEAPPVAEPAPFDVCGDLPSGTTVLEASAGTGKTYAIAALAARYVADGVELSQIMMVTFGRMATNELRLRVRERLTAAARRLAEARDQLDPAEPLDDVERLLTDGSPEELARRHVRLSRALSDFDAATIATTHEFCQRMLDGLGVLGTAEVDGVFVEELTELAGEVARDLYLQRYAADGRTPMGFTEAEKLAQQVVQSGHTRLVPALDPPDSSWEAAERVAFAVAVRAEVARRKAASRLVTYDDLLTRLRDALTAPRTGAAAAYRLRDRYSVVLVDEFQDTDPVQWDILRLAFDGHVTLVLIGDPKQAIYAFRGADVFSYLDARDRATRIAGLTTNWRSDAPLTDALHALLGGTALGDPRIRVREVHSQHPGSRLDAGRQEATVPVRLRVLPFDPELPRPPRVDVQRAAIQADLVADVTTLLSNGVQLRTAHGQRPVQPHDIAVLVRSNRRGEAIRDALLAAGVPTVMHGASSVYASAVAHDWLTLLAACEQPRQRQVRAAALTSFVGWTFARLATATDDELSDLTVRVRGWGRLLAASGVAALLEAVTGQTRLTERLLSTTGGERVLTDVRHIAQSLHAEMVSRRLGVAALTSWLREQITQARGEVSTHGLRRLESDAAAVQILTLHRSKGLEFPIVYLPEAWDRYVTTGDVSQLLSLHDDDGDCVLDVGGVGGAGRGRRLARALAEDAGEELRLLYVGLTRAQSQVVTWWAPASTTATSPLQRILFRTPGVAELPLRCEVTADPLGREDLRAAGIAVEVVEPRSPVAPPPVATSPPRLEARRFDRVLDTQWRRTSYSALTAAVHGLHLAPVTVGSEPEPTKEDDEGTTTLLTTLPTAAPVLDVDEAGLDEPSPMRLLPTGAEFGTVAHAVYEEVDPTAADLPAEVLRATRVALASGAYSAVDVGPESLATALVPSLLSPLGPLMDSRRLCDVDPRDRLTELSFELPLAGGDQPGAHVTLGEVGPLIARHLDPGDPLASYPDLLAHPALADQVLRGYLTGSIDAVLRVHDSAAVPRYLVVDYKTNWLGEFDDSGAEPRLTVADYIPARMASAMMAAHYPLQALLYSVALHRMLRWRQREYDPETHLGGILYLFVRGMAGADTPIVDGMPCGAFGWRPPARLVTELSDLLDGAT